VQFQAVAERRPETASRRSATANVSGTIVGPGGPVEGVWVAVGSPMDWQEDITDANGHYAVSIETDGHLWFNVRPDIVTRLTQANRWMAGITTTLTQDFTLTNGYLLAVQPTADGVPLAAPIGLDVQPLEDPLQEGRWYQLEWDDWSQLNRAVLPPDVYYLTARDVPAGYYQTTLAFDLRTADLTATLPLNTAYVHPIPYEPPDASKISFGAPDGLGEVLVTGTAGAALPLAQILLVNLNSAHQAHTTSESDGSFSTRIYAPPGSAIMVKHGPPGHRWDNLEAGVAGSVDVFPGTIINLSHSHDGGAYGLPFAAAGAVQVSADDIVETPNYVASAWAISGTLSTMVAAGRWSRILTGTYEGAVWPGLYLGGLNFTHPALSDLDGDGDLELLVGERSGQLALYRNQGTPSAPDWQFETDLYANVRTGGWAYPALVDVTADGAPDMFVGTGDGRVLVYFNQGTPADPSWPATPDSTLPAGPMTAAPALVDLDGDGDLDLLSGRGEEGTLAHFENTGTPSAPEWTFQTDAYAGISEPGHPLQPSFVDLDDDNDLDLLVGRCGDLVWYRNEGPPSNPAWTRVTDGYIGFEGSCNVSPGLGDWDDDGASDLVTGEHWGGLRFFLNQGPPNWTEQSFPFPFELAGDTAPALADWDNDGDRDLLLGQAHGQVHQYSNIGDATAPDWQYEGILIEIPWTDHPHAFPTFADIDGDSDVDLFIGEGGWQGDGAGGNIHYYRNDGTPGAPNWVLVSDSFLGLDVGGWSTPVFVDINDDGDLDLFIGDEAGTLTFVENTGTPTVPTWGAPVQPYAGLELPPFSAPAFFDVDEDNDLDLLVGSEFGSLSYVQNVGNNTSPAWELVSTAHPDLDIGERSVPSVADVDGDGTPELFLGDGDGGLNLFSYAGPATPPSPGVYNSGDIIQVTGTMRLYGQAITATTDIGAIEIFGWPGLLMHHNAAGHPLSSGNTYNSTLLTPSGFPIQGNGRAGLGLPGVVFVENLHYVGGHIIEGDFSASLPLPDDTPAGFYRPTIIFDFINVPTSTDWLAAHVTHFTFGPNEAPLAPIQVGEVSSTRRLIWRLLMDDIVQGTHGTAAREDRGLYEFSPLIVSQGAAYHTPPIDARTGQTLTYRLEPFMPMVSYTDRRLPTPPLIPFALPGGQLNVTVRQPDGAIQDLGSEPLAQSFNRTKSTRLGADLNIGTTQYNDVYSLMAASERFRHVFDRCGHYVVTMTGTISDAWGNSYMGGGSYDLWVAHPLDIDPGVLPGTPLAVGDAFNPVLQFYPRVPAEVLLTVTLYPDSDPAQAIAYTMTGIANRFGYFASADELITMTHPGEYRVDLAARYTDPDDVLYMGSMTWGGIVMTPENQSQLVAHGRRGMDSLSYIPNHWFVNSRDLTISEGAVSHSYNPYYNGDLLWSRMIDGAYGGDALLIAGSVQDTVGTIEAAIQARFERQMVELAPPGTFEDRVAVGELPLFISTLSGRSPHLVLGQIGSDIPADVDQIAYAYRSSQRPGVRVRELITEDGQNGGYWRLDTLYDDQLGVGMQGDQPNDFKFQYVGAVYRDLQTGHNEYVGQGTGWVFLPDDDELGTRVMPPFAGPGNGGWTTEGGPILVLKGEQIHIFVLPTGTRPGAILEKGDVFRFAGHVMPTLDSQVAITLTAPSGAQYVGGGQANSIGYYCNPVDDQIVNEAGWWSVDVHVWHDGQCSGGQTVPPYPQGDVLGSESGRYWFYVVPTYAQRLDVSTPEAGFLSFEDQVTSILITGTLPAGLEQAVVDYTISMPGYILEHGQVTPSGGLYQILFDPVALHEDFPNLDLVGRDELELPGLADTFAIAILLRGKIGESTIYRANTITLQGEQVFVGDAPAAAVRVYLPLIQKGVE
jgi:hypothetical protein